MILKRSLLWCKKNYNPGTAFPYYAFFIKFFKSLHKSTTRTNVLPLLFFFFLPQKGHWLPSGFWAAMATNCMCDGDYIYYHCVVSKKKIKGRKRGEKKGKRKREKKKKMGQCAGAVS